MTGSLAYYNPHTKWLVAILYAKQLTRVLDTQMISNLRSPKTENHRRFGRNVGSENESQPEKKPVQEVTIGGIVAPNYKPEKHMFDRFKNLQFYPLVNEEVKLYMVMMGI